MPEKIESPGGRQLENIVRTAFDIVHGGTVYGDTTHNGVVTNEGQTNLSGNINPTGQVIADLFVKKATPALRLKGTEGSAKDWRIAEDAGLLKFQENTATEVAPTWITRFTLDSSGFAFAYGGVIKSDGDFVTASATFVDVTGLTVTITTAARRCRVSAVLSAFANLQGTRVDFALLIDGASVVGTDGIARVSTSGTTAPEGNASFSFVSSVLSAGSHTFKIQMRATGGATATLKANTTMMAALQVEELPLVA